MIRPASSSIEPPSFLRRGPAHFGEGLARNAEKFMKLIALYKQPVDTAAFDKTYFETHIPLLRKVPGLQKLVISRITRSLTGDNYYLMAELHFADQHTLRTAMKSPEMAAAGENLNTFAEGLVTMLFADEVSTVARVT
jgi:uncharacterized protein (TIGR02118 family)